MLRQVLLSDWRHSMSTSLLYHAFGIRGYIYTRTAFVGGTIHFAIDQGKKPLALASWCAMRGRMCKIGGVVSGGIPGRGGEYPCPSNKMHAGWTPIVSVWRHTMRATDGLQTTITLGSVKPSGQVFSLELSLEMSLPMPQQDEHLPDQIEAFVHQAGLTVQRRLFQVLIEKADQELVLQRPQGKGGA